MASDHPAYLAEQCSRFWFCKNCLTDESGSFITPPLTCRNLYEIFIGLI